MGVPEEKNIAVLLLADNTDHFCCQCLENHQPRTNVAGYVVVSILVVTTFVCLLAPLCGSQQQKHLVSPQCDEAADCRITIVESIPENLTYAKGSPLHLSTYDSWMELINVANKSIDIAAFYWTLRGADVGHDDPSDWQGETILKSLLSAIKDRNIKVRIVNNHIYPMDNDSQILSDAGAEVRMIDFHKLLHSGVLHTKLWIVDGMHMYVGSANMDWRSLTQVKELGAVLSSCPCFVSDAQKLFEVYWYMGIPGTPIPNPWPDSYSTTFNKENPMKININLTQSMVYMSSSPPPFCPRGRTSDIDALVDVINKADKFIYIAVMDYEPLIAYNKPKLFWPVIDDALRKVSIEKGVKVRLLASKWNHTERHMFQLLQSIADVDGVGAASIEVKLFEVPATESQAQIPFARVNHNKYMVTDNLAYIGTSNWSGDYFVTTAGVALIVNQSTPQQLVGRRPHFRSGSTVRQQLEDIFNRDWNSQYSHSLPGSDVE